MKKSKKIFILLTLVLIMSATALSGCAAGIGNGRIANQSNNTLSRKIIKGKTTESQIKQMFGDPDKTTFNSKDDLMWTYEYQHDHDTVAAYIPVVNWFAKDVKGHKKMLVILFNKKGIVKNYAFSNSSNSMSLFNIINDKNKEKLYDFKKEELLALRSYYTIEDFVGIKNGGSNILNAFVQDGKTGVETEKIAVSAAGSDKQPHNCNNRSNNGIFSVDLNFITPTKIIFNEKIVQKLEFHTYIRSLLRRISNLNFFHCVNNNNNNKDEINDNPDKNINFNYYIEKAYSVAAKNILTWKSVDRYSNRQKRHMKISGFTGEILFENVEQEFLWIIKLGEIIHLGKNTTFGNGKYKINYIV